jgi:palmitoyl-protein thioesterase
MQSLTKHTAKLLGDVYGTCVPTGDTQHEDTINGYFLDMNSSVERFSEKVKADSKLADGFYAIGLSQGNNVIRGYIAKHNDPPVKRFISINGVNAGVGVSYKMVCFLF